MTGTLSIAEASDMLGISERNAYELARTTGQLTEGVECFKVGSKWKISRYALEVRLGLLDVREPTSSEPDHDTVPARQSPPAPIPSSPHARAGSESQQKGAA